MDDRKRLNEEEKGALEVYAVGTGAAEWSDVPKKESDLRTSTFFAKWPLVRVNAAAQILVRWMNRARDNPLLYKHEFASV